MDHPPKFAAAVFVLGFAAGCGAWYLFSPLLVDRVVSQELPAGISFETGRTGSFHDADAAHRGSGQAQILKIPNGSTMLRLSGLKVTNGNDLEVWLVADKDPKKASDVKASKVLSLGRLQGNVGDQTYVVPSGTDMMDFNSVVIWSARFGMLYAIAPLATKTG